MVLFDFKKYFFEDKENCSELNFSFEYGENLMKKKLFTCLCLILLDQSILRIRISTEQIERESALFKDSMKITVVVFVADLHFFCSIFLNL